MSFQIGYVVLGFAVLGVVTTATMSRENLRFALICLLLGGLGLFLTTGLSAIAYRSLSLLQFVQFPWRFLAVSTLFFSAVSGLCTCFRSSSRQRRLVALLPVAALLCCYLFSREHRSVQEMMRRDLVALENDSIFNNDIGAMSAQNEFLPRWVSSDTVPLQFNMKQLLYSYSGYSRAPEIIGANLTFLSDPTYPDTRFVIPYFYFPGWQAEVDGRATPIGVGPAGFISIPKPADRRTIKIS